MKFPHCEIGTLLSKPPQATTFCEGPYAQAMTQVVGIVIACSLFVVKASQTINLPSCQKNDNFRQFVFCLFNKGYKYRPWQANLQISLCLVIYL